MTEPPKLTVVVSRPETAAAQSVCDSEIPDSLKKMSAAERKVWAYVTESLKEAGLIHKTDAMMLNIIVKTFCRWVDAEAELEKFAAKNDGSIIIKTPNGYEQPHQLFHVASRLKKELLQWLPEACLTIPSFRRAKGLLNQPVQPGLFDNALSQFVGSKPRLVSG